jgi:hypothetical protein
VTAQVYPGNNRFTGSEGVLLSSTFLISSRPIAIDPGATQLRSTTARVSAGRFYLTDAWLMPSPAGSAECGHSRGAKDRRAIA